MRFSVTIGIAMLTASLLAQDAGKDFRGSVTNRAPLKQKAYYDLPLGTIQPRGWLKTQLERQRDGLTGDLDKHYPQVVGPRNGWLGGDGDGWERGPYWIDGLLPLAYILKDEALIAKAKPWVEWALATQEPSGYFGPKRFKTPPQPEPGIQKTPREDWWPRMVMLKVLQQYYGATGDRRVIDVLLKYFKYQAEQLPKTPLDHWSFWGNRRGGDNLMVVYWLYNLTGEDFLLKLGETLHEQTFPWTRVFLNRDPAPSPDQAHLYPYNIGNRYPFKAELIDRLSVSQLQSFHCVNLAQGIKEPIVFYQQQPDTTFHRAVKLALAEIKRFHGQPQGMYGADEPMHGNSPTQGVEFCSVVEMMFSLEAMLGITGDMDFADHLELIAYNALPTQSTEDFRNRQYFQCANQVMVTRARRNFYEEDWHGNTDLVFGMLNGYPCCTCNMHQGWPKFVQNLWYGTPDGGLAAVVYGPCEVSTKLADGTPVKLIEETSYPFEEQIRVRLEMPKASTFPLSFRVPHWAKQTRVGVNGQPAQYQTANREIRVQRSWNVGDTITLEFDAEVQVNRWVENSVAVERGPLLYALRIEEDWKQVPQTDQFGSFFEIRPLSPWNYGLTEDMIKDHARAFELRKPNPLAPADYPWTLQKAPLALKAQAKRIPEWQLYNHMAGPLPHSRPPNHLEKSPTEEITLIPYGCTKLRITEFPVVK
jgi:hypothetical protein